MFLLAEVEALQELKANFIQVNNSKMKQEKRATALKKLPFALSVPGKAPGLVGLPCFDFGANGILLALGSFHLARILSLKQGQGRRLLNQIYYKVKSNNVKLLIQPDSMPSYLPSSQDHTLLANLLFTALALIQQRVSLLKEPALLDCLDAISSIVNEHLQAAAIICIYLRCLAIFSRQSQEHDKILEQVLRNFNLEPRGEALQAILRSLGMQATISYRSGSKTLKEHKGEGPIKVALTRLQAAWTCSQQSSDNLKY